MARKDALLKLHQSLIAKRDVLRKKLEQELAESDRGDHTGDSADTASEDVSNELSHQIAALESRELNQIEDAIALIRNGRYGRCDRCGDKIPMARLQALPFSLSCIDCQRKQEILGHRSGYDANWESVYDYEGSNSERELTLGELEAEF